MSRFGVRALKWPFTSKQVEKVVSSLERYEQAFARALQVDQIYQRPLRGYRQSLESMFKYQPLDSSEFRLLKIQRTSTTIVCSLKHFSTEHAPPYNALSYSWGLEGNSADILCNRSRLGVTPHLFEGLHSLHILLSDEYLWVDSICINQEDEEEKAQQVSQMGTIYRNASRVQVWLGVSDESTTQATQLIHTIATQLHVDRIRDPSDSTWEAVREFFARSWFKRVWVIQEILLAKDIYVLCGPHFLSWNEIHAFATRLERTPNFHPIFDSMSSNLSDIIQLGAFRSSMGCNYSRESFKSNSFMFLLDLVRRRESKERIDRVYGILGVADPSIQEKIDIDYSPGRKIRFWEAYIELGKALLEAPGFRLLMQAPSKDRMSGLPTWCPNLGSARAMTDNWKHFSAGVLPEGLQWSCPPHVSFGEDSVTIITRGISMDKVGLVYSPLPEVNPLHESVRTNADNILDFTARVLEVFERTYAPEAATLLIDIPCFVDERKRRNVWFNTLVGGTQSDGKPYSLVEPHHHKAFEQYRSISNGSVSEFEPYGAHVYRKAMETAWYGTGFFTTRNGQFGLGPDTMRAGDEICIFFTAPVPFVLRRQPSGDAFEILGPAYIHDYMDGTAFKQRDPVNTFQSFTIC